MPAYPQLMAPPMRPVQAAVVHAAPAAAVEICQYCNNMGHQARTCPQIPRPAPAPPQQNLQLIQLDARKVGSSAFSELTSESQDVSAGTLGARVEASTPPSIPIASKRNVQNAEICEATTRGETRVSWMEWSQGPAMNVLEEEIKVITSEDSYSGLALIDTGSNISTISDAVVSFWGLKTSPMKGLRIESLAGSTSVQREVDLRFQLGNETWEHTFAVVHSPPYQVLLGMDFLELNRAEISLGGKRKIVLHGPVKSNAPKKNTKAKKDHDDCITPEEDDDSPLIKVLRSKQFNQTWINGNLTSEGGVPLEFFYNWEQDDSPDLDTLPYQKQDNQESYEFFVQKIRMLNLPKESEDHLISLVPKEICSRSLEELSEDGASGMEYETEVNLENDPVNLKPFKLGFVLEHILGQEIDKYVRGGRWKRGSPKWTSPVFLHLVPKHREVPEEITKNKLRNLPLGSSSLEDLAQLIREHYSVRLVHDYRVVNSRTPLDIYPMTDVRDFRRFTQGKRYFSIVDMKSAFYQIRLGLNAQQVFGITTPFGTYIPQFLGFGPKSAPAASSRLLHRLLDGLGEHCSGRIDDIIIATEDINKHLEVLGEIFRRMKNLNRGEDISSAGGDHVHGISCHWRRHIPERLDCGQVKKRQDSKLTA